MKGVLKGLTLWAFTAALMGSLSGCAPFNYTLPDSPLASTTVALMQLRPRVALVLSSGGPRGYAQIGVMRVLEEAGIEVDLVVGTSVVGVATALLPRGFKSKVRQQILQVDTVNKIEFNLTTTQ